jgi:hypothetical protein
MLQQADEEQLDALDGRRKIKVFVRDPMVKSLYTSLS